MWESIECAVVAVHRASIEKHEFVRTVNGNLEHVLVQRQKELDLFCLDFLELQRDEQTIR